MSLAKLISQSNGQAQKTAKVYGVVTGIVRDLRDPANLGRVKVDFPWLGEASDAVSISFTDDRAHSSWARIAILMAGSQRGTYFIPDVGDEVLVAFEHGDLDLPVVLGCLWSDDDKPPESMDGNGNNDIRSIHSRSGHVITLNDSASKPSISIVDKTGENSILIDSANNAMQIKVKGDLTIEAGGNISIKADGKLEIQAGQDLGMQTMANMRAAADASVEVKGNSCLKLESGGQAELKGMSISVNGSAMTEVKGGLVKIN